MQGFIYKCLCEYMVLEKIVPPEWHRSAFFFAIASLSAPIIGVTTVEHCKSHASMEGLFSLLNDLDIKIGIVGMITSPHVKITFQDLFFDCCDNFVQYSKKSHILHI